MIRLAELALFLAPLAAYVLWRMALQRGAPGPTPAMLGVITACLLLFGAGLVWFSLRERAPPTSHYVPPHLRDGQIVPGHAS